MWWRLEAGEYESWHQNHGWPVECEQTEKNSIAVVMTLWLGGVVKIREGTTRLHFGALWYGLISFHDTQGNLFWGGTSDSDDSITCQWQKGWMLNLGSVSALEEDILLLTRGPLLCEGSRWCSVRSCSHTLGLGFCHTQQCVEPTRRKVMRQRSWCCLSLTRTSCQWNGLRHCLLV